MIIIRNGYARVWNAPENLAKIARKVLSSTFQNQLLVDMENKTIKNIQLHHANDVILFKRSVTGKKIAYVLDAKKQKTIDISLEELKCTCISPNYFQKEIMEIYFFELIKSFTENFEFSEYFSQPINHPVIYNERLIISRKLDISYNLRRILTNNFTPIAINEIIATLSTTFKENSLIFFEDLTAFDFEKLYWSEKFKNLDIYNIRDIVNYDIGCICTGINFNNLIKNMHQIIKFRISLPNSDVIINQVVYKNSDKVYFIGAHPIFGKCCSLPITYDSKRITWYLLKKEIRITTVSNSTTEIGSEIDIPEPIEEFCLKNNIPKYIGNYCGKGEFTVRYFDNFEENTSEIYILKKFSEQI